MAAMSEKQLEKMVSDALEKEETLWKPLELSEESGNNMCAITYDHRADIIEWLSQVSTKFEFYPEALSLAVSILDRFLSMVKVQIKYLKCVSLSCLYIASKITEEDEVVPHIYDLVTQSSANCSTDDVVRMERLILNKLDWNVNLVTPLHLLQMCHAYLMIQCPTLLTSVRHMTPARQLAFLTHKLQLCLTSARACQWSPAMLAVSLISLELEQFRSDWFPLTLILLKFIKRVNFSNLIACREQLSYHLALTIQKAQQVASSRQQKRVRHNTNFSNSNKRKMTEPLPDQDDIYLSIKMLYDEDNGEEIPEVTDISAKLNNED